MTPERASGSPQSSEPTPIEILEALWKALTDHYPMMEYMGAHGDAWLEEFRPKVQAAPTREAAFDLMDELVCRLNDYHTRFRWKGSPPRSSPAVRVEPVLKSTKGKGGNQIEKTYASFRPLRKVPQELPKDVLDDFTFAVVQAGPETGVSVGEELVSVDGKPLQEALAHAWRHAVGSSRVGKLKSAAGWMLRGHPEIPVELGLRSRGNGSIRTVKVSRKTGFPGERVITSRKVQGIPVIRIRGWGNDGGVNLIEEFDRLLEKYRGRRGLIFDVRGNGGGSDALADQVTGRFLKEPVISSISFHRKVPSLDYRRTVEWAQPRGPWRFAGRVAVLTDEGCMSACEHFVSGMAEAGALLAGTPTSGACGWSRTLTLPGGAQVNVSQTFPLHTAGLPSPLLGIAPHLWLPPTLSDLRTVTDMALEGALQWIKSEESLPQRAHWIGG